MSTSEIARLCIVGSDKGGVAALAREDSLTGAVLRELEALPPREGSGPQEEDARKFLLASGIAALQTLEQTLPQPGEELPPALEEHLPEGPDPRALFVSRHPHEVLAWLRRQGRRLPAVFLPEAVQWATSGRHDDIWPVLGRTGAQLCRDNPAWQRLLANCETVAAKQAAEENAPAWEDASPGVRRLLLRRLRAQDPRAGRELAAPLLLEQFAKHRELLYDLRIGLSAEDLPLLEECCRKKSDKYVRYAVRVLLSLLPESRFAREMAGGDVFAWKNRKLVLTPGEAEQEWTKGLSEEVCLTVCPLDVWLARSGKNCRELLAFLLGKPQLEPLTMRIFLEDRKDWLRVGLETALEAASGTAVPSGLSSLGTLAAAMLPREEIEDWLSRLLRGVAPGRDASAAAALNPRVCDALAAPMLLHARFPLSRERWSEYVAAIGRRAQSLFKTAADGKNTVFNIYWQRGFTALWSDAFSDFAPETFDDWTYGEFSGAYDTTSLLYHCAWKMPLDALEQLAQALLLPDASLFEKERQELEDIRAFRAQLEQKAETTALSPEKA